MVLHPDVAVYAIALTDSPRLPGLRSALTEAGLANDVTIRCAERKCPIIRMSR